MIDDKKIEHPYQKQCPGVDTVWNNLHKNNDQPQIR